MIPSRSMRGPPPHARGAHSLTWGFSPPYFWFSSLASNPA
ncbi:hypothetical protein SLNWT_2249 [Streptomyces albus]|uniref:Uncharacterized protein n=1 Tax=Streptomyces albus (strain ATCC 21838 / DSM 41398 / FERM P-419 / JCM 4703 / NBRC 107858) TaxID=1081613 RepID=A0A0B5ETQ3_STRA4|nr:hypothetical protein SLNWT_2249 [Streptomyces albus]AOU76938.1 hypothetical protein SLNHY_2247 [Streptomyces albus]AYN32715.1 hypothetical protein DUI70_2213 [Streptomyces albus]